MQNAPGFSPRGVFLSQGFYPGLFYVSGLSPPGFATDLERFPDLYGENVVTVPLENRRTRRKLERFPGSYGVNVVIVPPENGHTRRKLERFPGSYGTGVVTVPPENGHTRRKLEQFQDLYGTSVVTVPLENSHIRRKLERFPSLYGASVVTTYLKTAFRWWQIRKQWWSSHRQTIMDVVAIGLPRLPLPSGVLICRNLAAWRTDLP